MRVQSCRNFLTGAALFALFAGLGLAAHHHELNGTWQMIPARSVLNGEPAIQSGTVNINDREGNISVSRTFNFDDANKSVTTKFDTDGRHNASIKDKDSGFKSKTKWDGDVLVVSTDHDGVMTTERYSLLSDGTMMLQVDRTSHPSETFYFQRQ